jgi:hypothetical protein
MNIRLLNKHKITLSFNFLESSSTKLKSRVIKLESRVRKLESRVIKAKI